MVSRCEREWVGGGVFVGAKDKGGWEQGKVSKEEWVGAWKLVVERYGKAFQHALYNARRSLNMLSRSNYKTGQYKIGCGSSNLQHMMSTTSWTIVQQKPLDWSPKPNFLDCSTRMKEIREKLDDIAEERMKFHLREVVVEKKQVEITKMRQTGSILTQPQVYGREEDMENIVEHLVKRLIDTPSEIGRLTCLKTLSLFVVGKRRGCHLTELKGLNLRGELCIKHLERVRSRMDTKEANLVGKQNLHHLKLYWERNDDFELQENVEQLLEALEPPPNIEELTIREYKDGKIYQQQAYEKYMNARGDVFALKIKSEMLKVKRTGIKILNFYMQLLDKGGQEIRFSN
ncbi:hypothetical protein F0562_011922 [Nyssa sinensis]|uniref:R13L1/DRL21-like LRR repeat region domain-containing protein n=1 Tax=Nyssa sinensis TaxID=561372 RepID=A0A5J4ZVR6_9ASTE|nr:hypothetical protein F0562_011922 [Nyssa sinensis]